MKLLVDMNLSPRWVKALAQAGIEGSALKPVLPVEFGRLLWYEGRHEQAGNP